MVGNQLNDNVLEIRDIRCNSKQGYQINLFRDANTSLVGNHAAEIVDVNWPPLA